MPRGRARRCNDERVLTFVKGHGTGNDFVVLPDPDGTLPLTPRLVAALCDRRRGIGGDGVLRVVRSAVHPDAAGQRDRAEWFMDYWNADGSPAELCGNGVRVYVRYLVDEGLVDPAGELTIATRDGVVGATVGTDEIAVRLRLPRVYAESAAVVGGRRYPGAAVDVGNPHLVCRLGDTGELADLDLSTSPDVDDASFPAGVNVEFMAVARPVEDCDTHVRMRVYERGSGETLSCGTGACAVAAVALRDAGCATGRALVDGPGGRLWVTFEADACWLAGPAVLVARGTVDPAALDMQLPDPVVALAS
jgi:diaminopimelate epimerase